MSGIINIEEHNKIIETLDAKKAAIQEAAKLGTDTLEANKPKAPTYYCKSIKMYPNLTGNKSIEGYRMSVNDHEFQVSYPNSFGHYVFSDNGEYLKRIAACIIKAFGPIPQELIDSVEAE